MTQTDCHLAVAGWSCTTADHVTESWWPSRDLCSLKYPLQPLHTPTLLLLPPSLKVIHIIPWTRLKCMQPVIQLLTLVKTGLPAWIKVNVLILGSTIWFIVTLIWAWLSPALEISGRYNTYRLYGCYFKMLYTSGDSIAKVQCWHQTCFQQKPME